MTDYDLNYDNSIDQTLRSRITELEAECETLKRRLAPAQGHGYENEVERQRVIIIELTHIAEQALKEKDIMSGDLIAQERMIRDLVGRNEELKAALRDFGWHDSDCDQYDGTVFTDPDRGRCTCGFAAALGEQDTPERCPTCGSDERDMIRLGGGCAPQWAKGGSHDPWHHTAPPEPERWKYVLDKENNREGWNKVEDNK